MATAIIMPRVGLNEEENLLGEIFVIEGDKVAQGDKLFDIETDKSSMSVYAESSGIVLKIFYNEFDTVQVLSPVCVTGELGEDFSEIEKQVPFNKEKNKELETFTHQTDVKESNESKATVLEHANGKMHISPRARNLAEKNGIDWNIASPSGAEGRIIENDIITIMANRDIGCEKEETTLIKFSRTRNIIAEKMVKSLQSMAQLTHQTVFDASEMLTLKDEYKEKNKRITIGDLILYGVSRSLKDFPEMNSHMLVNNEMIQYKRVHLGVAVDTSKGLMVPTIFKADTLSLEEISLQVTSLAKGCKEGNISSRDLKDSTFTVTNIGNIGIRYFTPIINPPQVAILGVGTIDYQVRKTSRGMEFYPAGFLSLTYDHRAIDGVPASKFLKHLCLNLENIRDLIN